jgi:hypothetical protein
MKKVLLAMTLGLMVCSPVLADQDRDEFHHTNKNKCGAVQMGGSILLGQPSGFHAATPKICRQVNSAGQQVTWSLGGFLRPTGITTDGVNLYVTDASDSTIRSISLDKKEVTILAGASGVPGNQDGVGTSARFVFPTNITTDGTSLYVSDNQSHTIRKIVIASGAVSTLAGDGSCGSEDGHGVSARFCRPEGITTDGKNLYVADNPDTGSLIRKIDLSSGRVVTLAGDPNYFGTVDGVGAAARLSYPLGITTDGTNVFFTEWIGSTVRKLVIATGEVVTLAGQAGQHGTTDGTGSAALFATPAGIANDGNDLFVSEWFSHTIRKIVIETGAVTTLAVPDIDGVPASSFSPNGITLIGESVFITDPDSGVIRKIQ